MTEQQYGRRAVEMGPTGQTTAKNLARLRKVRGLSARQLSAALERVGRSVSASGITRMEKAERHVTADELVALAAVFDVSPSALLLPLDDAPDSTVEITGAGTVPATVAWDWMDGRRPLRLPEEDPATALLDHALYSRPPRRRDVSPVVNAGFQNLASLQDPGAREAIHRETGLVVGEPRPIPEKYRRSEEDTD